ncbi:MULTISPECIES: DUF3099 domain-containing protein [Microbacterium]|uniref:DUF3099 domain-containing protein n=1 Tax=Microbacterium TaxID=33882 RepID=UPI0023DA117C|nr:MULTISPECIES: DUF3099 domain-containing protein [Microbacterium]MDF2046332.1 DUF3099 domain-containing protein [Microbacterium sp. Kw_RZR3]MDQ1077113.1 hypothetical protein [Microbacterium sp. SORGH_AS_0969]MDQ1117356.1 hypothetical protein [Microbacterium testaceum]
MKTSSRAQSATSLPQAPREDAGSRFTKYMVMMGIRIACFVLMAVVQPYGWYTFVFAAGAIFLPYLAVIVANVGADVGARAAEAPERSLEASAPAAPTPAPAAPTVIRIAETSRLDAARDDRS